MGNRRKPGRWSLATAVVCLLAFAACDYSKSHDDTVQVNNLKAEPMFYISVPGGHPGRVLANGGGAGPNGGPIGVMRQWDLDALNPSVVAAVITAERASGVTYTGSTCSGDYYSAGGINTMARAGAYVSFKLRPPTVTISANALSPTRGFNGVRRTQVPGPGDPNASTTLPPTFDSRCPPEVTRALGG
jgi:hypothetical protein